MGLFSSIGGILGSVLPIPGAGVIGSVIGNALDGDASRDVNNASVDASREANATNLAIQRDKQAFDVQASRTEYERQKEFAQMGIRWKMDDARAAGLHPVAALGGTGSMYSPSAAVSGQFTADKPSFLSRSSSSIDVPGQNTLRAQMATKTDVEKEMEALALRRGQLQNALLEGQVAAQWSSVMGQPPGVPAPVSVGPRVAPVGAVRVEPSKVTSRDPGHSGMEAGSTPAGKSFDLGGGLKIALPSQAASESFESMGPLSAPLALTIGGARRWWHGPDQQPSLPAPGGSQWVWSPWSQSFKLERPAAPSKTHNRGSYLLRR